MGGEAGGDGVGVFAVDGGEGLAVEGFGAGVVAELDAVEDVAGVHDVGFGVDDGAVEEAVGEEVAAPDVVAVGDFDGVVALVDEGWEAGGAGGGGGEGAGDGEFLGEGAAEEFVEHVEALVFAGEFVGAPGAGDEEVEVVGFDEGGFGGVAPGFGVEVEGDDEVGFDPVVDDVGAGADLGGAVEEAFTFELDGAWGGGFVFVAEGGFGVVEEFVGAEACGGGGAGAGEVDVGAEGFEAGDEEFGDEEGHVAFGDGFGVADLEPAFFHAGPFAADVAGVEGDDEA